MSVSWFAVEASPFGWRLLQVFHESPGPVKRVVNPAHQGVLPPVDDASHPAGLVVVVHRPPLRREGPLAQGAHAALEVQQFLVLARGQPVRLLYAPVVGPVTLGLDERAMVF
jgi:hypothetical protein